MCSSKLQQPQASETSVFDPHRPDDLRQRPAMAAVRLFHTEVIYQGQERGVGQPPAGAHPGHMALRSGEK